MAKDQRVFTGTGRRKTSVARVRLIPGSGKITVNGRDVNEYMPFEVLVMDLKQPLEITNNLETFDVIVNVNGGGFSGQTGAIRLGITRALLEYDKENENNEDSYRKILKAAGFVTRDARRKKETRFKSCKKGTTILKEIINYGILKPISKLLIGFLFYFLIYYYVPMSAITTRNAYVAYPLPLL